MYGVIYVCILFYVYTAVMVRVRRGAWRLYPGGRCVSVTPQATRLGSIVIRSVGFLTILCVRCDL